MAAGSLAAQVSAQIEMDPAYHWPTYNAAEKGSVDDQANARASAAGAAACAVSHDCPCRIHQRRKIDPIQSPDQGRCRGQGHALCDPRSDTAADRLAKRSQCNFGRYCRIHIELPTQLVAAFRATLEDVEQADIIIHVRDASHQDSEAQKDDVMRILEALGVKGQCTRD